MTDAELRQLALDIVDGRVVGTWSMHETPERVGLTFPLLHMLDNEQYKRVEQSAHIYEYRERAMPMGVNGQPMFFEFHIMDMETWDKLRPLLRELSEWIHADDGAPEPEQC